MKLFRPTAIIASLLLLFTACAPEEKLEGGDDLLFNVESSASETKSALDADACTKVTDVNFFVYKNGTLQKTYYNVGNHGISGKSIFPNFTDKFNVYILCNVGDYTSAAPQNESDIAALQYTFLDFGYFSSKGFPMASSYLSYNPGTDSRSLKASKLVTQYNMTFSKSSGNPNSYTLNSAKFKDIPAKIQPFGAFSIGDDKDDKKDDGDSLTAEDIAAANNGTAVQFFVLENEQGNVFTGNTDPKNKTYENLELIEGGKFKDKCTYIEMDFSVQTPTAYYDHVKYRYYFGDSPSDCSIHRNYIRELHFNFDNIIVEDEGWMIEPEDPEVDEDAIVLDKEEFFIIKGYDEVLKVKHGDISYTYNASASGVSTSHLEIEKLSASRLSALGITPESGCDYYLFHTDYNTGNPSTLTSATTVNVPVTFTSYDHMVTKTALVRVITDALAIRLEEANYENNNFNAWNINGYNPFNLDYDIEMTGNIWDGCAYRGDGGSLAHPDLNKKVVSTGFTARWLSVRGSFQEDYSRDSFGNTHVGLSMAIGNSVGRKYRHYKTKLGTDTNYRHSTLEGVSLTVKARMSGYPDIPLALINTGIGDMNIYWIAYTRVDSRDEDGKTTYTNVHNENFPEGATYYISDYSRVSLGSYSCPEGTTVSWSLNFSQMQ